MRLATFITNNLEPILQAWEDFAKTITPATKMMDSAELRDHAEQMLKAIAEDLQTPQTTAQQIDKSKGNGPGKSAETAAETHAVTRLVAGFTLDQMVSEYRALRSSVLMQWLQQIKTGTDFEVEDMTRFNEAIDQALAESIRSYSRAVDASRNVFLGILGHDLRTPLGAILLGSEVLLRAEEMGIRQTKIASRIYTSVKRANKIVSDLLDFTRSQIGTGIPVQLSETNLALICESMVEEVRAYHPECNIVLESNAELIGQFDGARMEQVFSNLIGNAVQHGNETAPITVSLLADQGFAVFSVRNQGEPIAEEAIPHIFNPMSRHSQYAAGEHGPSSGLGLGLYIAGEIVAAHQGRIEVESRIDLGTVFTVRLPMVVCATEG
ncbi:sensor histidine kinase [Stutzerimonas xanthomarina]|uniref:histidine kinase n=2 Tax=Stutzerimonas xanthomarina TaxID=271420 RepID=A0A1M5L8G8_9GAMM|nr:sensor histidine kinase [Stutzerimonas xanthomarina]MCP9340310.1 sensor histidine kinase [Stutzerimonas xanthomarina]SEH51343.1 RsbT co-antagonist protein rsbRD N-terminal domain-containing protein [Stutzerimonas xanthomarina]SHG60703.1 RsbT co-antagonist protein rsbRD N-terminal domain-containing protein [Stutzerimonas xanthomarina DSM 18231]